MIPPDLSVCFSEEAYLALKGMAEIQLSLELCLNAMKAGVPPETLPELLFLPTS